MASNYPTSLDSFTDPTSGSSLASPSHSGQHIDLNDAVEKLETKLGIGSSPASSAVSGSVLKANGSGTTSYAKNGLWNITPTSVGGSGVSLSGSQVVFTASSTVNINGCFTDEFTNYRVIYRGTGSTSTVSVFFKMRVSGADSSTGYDQGGMYCTRGGATGTLSGTAGVTGWYLTNVNTTTQANFVGDFLSPKVAKRTNVTGLAYESDAGWWVTGQHQVDASYDGFTILVTSGTMTGTVDIYGYEN